MLHHVKKKGFVHFLLQYRGILTQSGESTLLGDVGETYFGSITLLTLNIYAIIVGYELSNISDLAPIGWVTIAIGTGFCETYMQ